MDLHGFIFIPGWWFHPRNILVSWDDEIPKLYGTCKKRCQPTNQIPSCEQNMWTLPTLTCNDQLKRPRCSTRAMERRIADSVEALGWDVPHMALG